MGIVSRFFGKKKKVLMLPKISDDSTTCICGNFKSPILRACGDCIARERRELRNAESSREVE